MVPQRLQLAPDHHSRNPDSGAVESEMASNMHKEAAIHPPSVSRLAEISQSAGLDLDDAELHAYRDVIAGTLKTHYQRLSELADPKLPVKYPRTPGHRPEPQDNPLNAWYWKCDIKGAPSGKLLGKTIAVKDNICVAGVPMTFGSRVLEGYVPDVDATVVTRMLDAGGHVIGKAVCESMCCDSVAGGHVTMALGGDQGGSIRMPASMCGIVGMKPTFGLVPYTGICPSEYSLDHVGPMARTVRDVALLLEVISGHDEGRDHRQTRVSKSVPYSEQLTGDVHGLRVGLLMEGFGHQASEPDVDAMVRSAARRLGQETDAGLQEVSVPLHRDGFVIRAIVAHRESWRDMLDGAGFGSSSKGYHVTGLHAALCRGLKAQPNEMSRSEKLTVLMGRFLHENNHDMAYCKAQNLGLELGRLYDEALETVDLLVMPTCPTKAKPFPSRDLSVRDHFNVVGKDNVNTSPFNLTGHPALSINAGFSCGLPVGMMLVGKKFDEATLLNAALAYERIRDAQPE